MGALYKNILLLFSCFLLSAECRSQFHHAGKEFYIGLGGGFAQGSIGLVSEHQAVVTFTYANTGQVQTYNLVPGQYRIIKLTTAEMTSINTYAWDAVDNKSLHIEADSAINVYLTSTIMYNDDAMMVIPVDKQQPADEFFTLGEHVEQQYGSHAIVMVAPCDSTVLEITPRMATYLHPAGIPFQVVLNKGETFRLSTPQGLLPLKDLSGNRIKVLGSKCCVPRLSVYSAYGATYSMYPSQPGGPLVTNGVCCADAMLDPLLPVNWWDTLHYVAPFANMPACRIKVVAAQNSTVVSFDGTVVANLNQGDFLDTAIYYPLRISSNVPVGVGQFMFSFTYLSDFPDLPATNGDPDMLWVLPLRDGVKKSIFRALGQHPFIPNVPRVSSWLNVIAKTSDVPGIILNGISISGSFNTFPQDTGMSYAYVKLDTGLVYSISSPGKFLANHSVVYIQGGYTYHLADMTAQEYLPVADFAYQDTIYRCPREVTTLNADPTAASWLWQDGSGLSYLQVTDSGWFEVLETAANGCTAIRRFTVVNKIPDTTYAKADTIRKCENAAATLSAASAAAYLWNTGDASASLAVIDTGLYTVLGFDVSGCNIYGQSFYIESPDIPTLSVSRDTTKCQGEQVTLYVTGNWRSVDWSDGQKLPVISVLHPGTYRVIVTDTCGNTYTDSILVNDKFCPDRFCNIMFPDVFTPNGDGRNDTYGPLTYGEITGFSLSVYNRWGERVFDSYKLEDKWDGSYKGQEAELGTYFYHAAAECPLKGNVVFKGTVTLVR